MKKIKYEINHHQWKFSVLDDDVYGKKHDKSSAAMTTFESKEVDFKKSELDLVSLRHELVHIHYYYCYTGSTTKLTLDDQEEIFAEMVADRLVLLHEQSLAIYEKLK